MGIDGLTLQRRAGVLLLAGVLLWLVPLSLRVDRFLQIMSFVASFSCFCAILTQTDELDYENKLQRQQRIKRAQVTAARFEYSEAAEVQQIQREYQLLPAGSSTDAAAPLPGTQQALDQAGEKLAQVLQHCGDAAIELIDYLWDGKAESISDEEGWIDIRQLRQNWGRHHGYNAETFAALLQKLTQLEVGEFQDSSLKKWRLLLVV